MTEMAEELDSLDIKILACLQADGTITQRALADRVGLSQNACWRRLQRLRAGRVILGTHASIDLAAVGLNLTVFVMIRTRHHSKEWADRFRKHVERLPEVIDFYRIGGNWDYLLKVTTTEMAGYDAFYQKLITNFDLETVTGFFSMEPIIVGRAADLTRSRERPRRSGRASRTAR